MDLYLKITLTLGALLTLLGVVTYFTRRFGGSLSKNLMGGGSSRRKLEVIERLGLDPKRQLILVRNGDREHFILLGTLGEQLIESKDILREDSPPQIIPLMEGGRITPKF